MPAVKPIVLYDQKLPLTGLIDDPAGNPAEVGFEADNAANWLTHNAWKPQNTGNGGFKATITSTVNAFAIFGHDIGTNGGTVVLQYWDGALWQDIFTPVSPSSTEVIIKLFPDQASSNNEFRVLVNSNPVSQIAVCFIGDKTELDKALQLPLQLPTLGAKPVVYEGVKSNAEFVGRIKLFDLKEANIGQQFVDPDDIRNIWRPFILHASKKPFFYSWNDTNFPAEGAYVWAKSVSWPVNNNQFLMDYSMELEGQVK